jgi:L-threonylcarbamoyladenylate synthase
MAALDLTPFVDILRSGGVLACPTETLVGLLADALRAESVARVQTIKRRGPDPIALLLPDLAQLSLVAEPPSERVLELARKHWPGPLTLVLRARPGLPEPLVREGTIGVRVPGPSPAFDLVRAFNGPLTATSCNPSGQPSARTEAEARAYFPNELDGFVPGDAPGGPASTVVDASGTELRVLRQGAIILT